MHGVYYDHTLPNNVIIEEYKQFMFLLLFFFCHYFGLTASDYEKAVGEQNYTFWPVTPYSYIGGGLERGTFWNVYFSQFLHFQFLLCHLLLIFSWRCERRRRTLAVNDSARGQYCPTQHALTSGTWTDQWKLEREFLVKQKSCDLRCESNCVNEFQVLQGMWWGHQEEKQGNGERIGAVIKAIMR